MEIPYSEYHNFCKAWKKFGIFVAKIVRTRFQQKPWAPHDTSKKKAGVFRKTKIK